MADATPETWNPIVGYEDIYEVSDQGRIRRIAEHPRAIAGWVMAQQPNSTGYPTIALRRNGTMRRHLVHRLVAAAFLGPCPLGHEVNHRDGVKTNGVLTNLEYVTPSGNQQHALRLGLRQRSGRRGEQNNAAKLTDADVAEIRRLYKPWAYSAVRLAREFGVSEDHIRRVAHGTCRTAP